MKRSIWVMMFAAALSGRALAADGPHPAEEALVHIGRLIYAQGQKTQCFSDKFLYTVRRETTIRVDRQFNDVKVGSADLFDYPMVLWFGEGAFSLTDGQVDNLRAYLAGGGFVLASSSCKDQPWNASFRKTLARVLPDHALRPLPMDHAVFSTIYQVSAVQCARSEDAKLYGVYLDDRLVMIWCPVDLRDPASMGSQCCCCGANYVRNAQQINANILAYVLTH